MYDMRLRNTYEQDRKVSRTTKEVTFNELIRAIVGGIAKLALTHFRKKSKQMIHSPRLKRSDGSLQTHND